MTAPAINTPRPRPGRDAAARNVQAHRTDALFRALLARLRQP